MNKNKGSHYSFNGFRHRKGFSIIEIIAAIVVLSILATISVNLMSDYKVRQNISSARQQVMNAMTSAFAAAARDNLPYAVRFNANHQVKVCDFDDGSKPKTAKDCDNDSNFETPFEHDLAMFSKPILMANKKHITLGTQSGDEFINYTQFGKIQVKADGNIAKTLDKATGFYTIYIDDEKSLDDEAKSTLKAQKLCLGIRFNASGFVESIEKARSNEGC